MAIQMNIAEAKAKLSELVARDGKPVVFLKPRSPPRNAPRRLGQWDHLGLDIPEDRFIGPDPEMKAWLETWENEPITPPE